VLDEVGGAVEEHAVTGLDDGVADGRCGGAALYRP
jgi:hypothetical protein